ncbi:hypothetical protein EUX98_g7482 [Antrodiella citrinella]|uniref:DJ-1/PfpI domain-containing protein n=1 Tax=Antrodiella citrinella TaxID=2447956 RepID=A0A4S4MLE7_9APHY|nr:hypothetical protein EUX98_g7482 [Antrodiella citrinella]
MSQPQAPPVLTLAICLFDEVTALDYQGPMELLGFVSPSMLTGQTSFGNPAYAIAPTYLSPKDGPVKPTSGPLLLASRTYDSVGPDEQFDIILIPGGHGVRPELVASSLVQFVKRQAPEAKYVLSVCTGSWVLALAGLLKGKRATTNKSCFLEIQESTKDEGVTWVPRARWIVDGNYWTSSGITAGTDMASAFLEHLLGAEVTSKIRGIAELSVRQQGDDEFAAVYGLV